MSHYDLTVLSMSVMGFQRKSFDRGVGGWVGELYPVFIWIFWHFVNFAKHTAVVLTSRQEETLMDLHGSSVALAAVLI